MFPEHYEFQFQGWGSYKDEIVAQIEPILHRTVQDANQHFLTAIHEAVRNAAAYGRIAEKTWITLRLLVNDGDVKAQIKAENQPFDVRRFRQGLQRLAMDARLGKMDWQDYVKGRKGQGFWKMLMAVEYLCVDVTGRQITLCAKRPFKENQIQNRISVLVARFYLEKNGVIF